MVALPLTLTNDTPADADDVMALVNALNSGLDSISNANIRSNAAIDDSKISQRYSIDEVGQEVLAYSAGANMNAPTRFTPLPAALATVKRWRVAIPTGGLAWLCEADFFCVDAVNSPTLAILVDGITLGGSAVTLTNTPDWFRVRNANPFSSPLLPLSDGSIIETQLDDGAGTGEARGIEMKFLVKRSKVS